MLADGSRAIREVGDVIGNRKEASIVQNDSLFEVQLMLKCLSLIIKVINKLKLHSG